MNASHIDAKLSTAFLHRNCQTAADTSYCTCSVLRCFSPAFLCRLLRAWSFQSKLGIITNTLFEAAPQLAPLLLVICCCIILFSGLAYLGLGHRVPYLSSYAAALEETFRSLLGLGYVKLPDVFPGGLKQSPAQTLLSALIYYGREMLFVMVLTQYFMATLGAAFMRLKRRTACVKGSSVGRDVVEHVLPELGSKVVRMLRGPEYSSSARDANGAAVEVPAGAEELHAFLKEHYPHLVESKAFGNRHRAIKIGGGYISAAALKQLLADLALTDAQVEQGPALAQQLLHTSVARRYWRKAEQVAVAAALGEDAAAARPSSDSEDEGDGQLPGWRGDAAAAAAAVVSDELVASVAAALAAARQLVSCCGVAVDDRELQAAQLRLQDVLEAVGTELRAGVDYNEQVGLMWLWMAICVGVCVAVGGCAGGCGDRTEGWH
jgi:hypothetical protein